MKKTMKKISLLFALAIMTVLFAVSASAEPQGDCSELGHLLPDEWTIVVEPTCNKEGLKIKRCTRVSENADGTLKSCDYYVETPIPCDRSQHIPGEWIIDEGASDNTRLVSRKYCTVCGVVVDTKSGPATFTVVFATDTLEIKKKFTGIPYGSTVDENGNDVTKYVYDENVFGGREPDAHYHYVFKSWDKDLSNGVTENTVVRPIYEAIRHTFDEPIAWGVTCTEEGGYKCMCSCGFYYIQGYIPALGHKVETIPGKAATCTEDGYTEGRRCVREGCGQVLKAQTKIEAGCNPYTSQEGISPTCTKPGHSAEQRCLGCGRVIVPMETYNPLGHIDNDNDGICDRCVSFSYRVLADGTAEITRYSGEMENLVIPSEIDGFKVTRIGNYAFSDDLIFSSDNSPLVTVVIPEGVTEIGRRAFEFCENLESITIPDSVVYIDYDILYGTALDDKENYTDGLLIVDGWAVAMDLEKILATGQVKIPADVKNFSDDLFYFDAPAYSSFIVDEDNPYYSSDEYGVLYNKDKTKLIWYPIGSKNTEYIIPDTVEDIEFLCCFCLETIVVPESVKKISGLIISPSLKNIYFYNDNIEITPESAICYGDIDSEKWMECREEFFALFEDYISKYINGTLTAEYEEAFNDRVNEILDSVELDNPVPYGRIHANEGSTAHAYAQSLGIDFKALGSEETHTCAFGEWYTVNEATVFEEGLEKRECESADCNEFETRTVAKLENAITKDETTNIEITYTDDNFDKAVEIVVAEDNNSANIVLGNDYEEFKAYDISLVTDGKKVQPNGFVTVKLPLPTGYNPATTEVYYISDDGEKTFIKSKIENGYVIFETDHFSIYAIVDKSSLIHKHSYKAVTTNETCEAGGYTTYTCDCGDTYTGDKTPAKGHSFNGSVCTVCGYDRAEECDCNCHASGIKKFFFNFILFFQKLFKKNQICEGCGAYHY